jgi:hypothetical protein
MELKGRQRSHERNNHVLFLICFHRGKWVLRGEEELAALLDGVVGAGGGVAFHLRVGKDLVIITTGESLVPEEVDIAVAVLLQVLQAVGLVPTNRENIEGDLTADRVLQAVVGELLLQELDHVLADVVGLVVLFKVVSLLLAAVSADGAHVQHTVAELDECAAAKETKDDG